MPVNKPFEWVKTIPDYQEYLKENYKTILDVIGIDKFLELMDVYKKTNLYFSEKPIQYLRKLYVKQNLHLPTGEIARNIGCSEQFVQQCISEMTSKYKNKKIENLNLFEDQDG